MSTPTTDSGTPLQTVVRKPKTEEEIRRACELERRYLRYACGICSTWHKDDWEASHCCGPDSAYVCPTCNEDWETAEQAERCERGHGSESAAKLEFASCPVCSAPHEDAEDAIECCLWRTMPFSDRLTLLDHVRFGRIEAAHAMITRH